MTRSSGGKGFVLVGTKRRLGKYLDVPGSWDQWLVNGLQPSYEWGILGL